VLNETESFLSLVKGSIKRSEIRGHAPTRSSLGTPLRSSRPTPYKSKRQEACFLTCARVRRRQQGTVEVVQTKRLLLEYRSPPPHTCQSYCHGVTSQGLNFNTHSTSIKNTKVSNPPFKKSPLTRGVPLVEIAREEQTRQLSLSDSDPCLSSPHLSFLIRGRQKLAESIRRFDRSQPIAHGASTKSADSKRRFNKQQSQPKASGALNEVSR
jgi:hypothetical protein